MDYDPHMRAAMHSSLCNVGSYGESTQAGSMMALMTTEQAEDTHEHHRAGFHHHQQQQRETHHEQKHQHECHHREQHDDHRQQQQLNIWQSNTVPSATLHPSSSFTYYNAAIVEPYLQSAILQATHAFSQPHRPENLHPPIVSALDHLEHTTGVVTAEEEKPDVGRTPKFVGGRDCNYMIATSGDGACLLESSVLHSTTHESRAAIAGTIPMEIENGHTSADHSDSIKSKIVSHPTYPRLVIAYVNCHKIGAPAEVVTSLEEIGKKYQTFRASSPAAMGADPDLDHFMETYCTVLQKYHDELMQPYKEAMAFFRKIELQLNALSKGTLRLSQSGDDNNNGVEANNGQQQHNSCNRGGSSVEEGEEGELEEGDASCGEVDFHEEMIDPLAEDQKLKEQLLRKYSGCIWSLKQDFMKKKKKGKLPKDARAKLLDWWTQHYKWPYPSETEKAGLAETTGLDQKQINNWFINQRKRHWKPSEDMQYVMLDTPSMVHHHPLHSQAHGHLAAHPLAAYAVGETMDAAAVAAAATIMPALQ